MKRILLSLLASGLCAGAMAIPAMPGFVEFTQPDGTVVNIRMVGDEHGHMVYSEGGLLLVDADGAYEYARFDGNGCPVRSGILASAENEPLARSLMLQNDENIENWAAKINAERLERIGASASRRSVATRTEAGDGGDRLVPMNFGRWDVQFPVFGEQKGLVVLVEYQDVEFEHSDHDYFHRLLNEEGFSDHGSKGSARDWFITNSNGQFRPEFDVYGPVKLPNERSYYGKNGVDSSRDYNAYMMAIDVCDLLDDEVDFSQYDRDNDGIIDNIFIFYAGDGEHESGVSSAVWPHSWDIKSACPDKQFLYDGVQLDHYACSCEYFSRYDRADGIGTFVHEFSHVMGLPDLYQTASYGTTPFTPGPWSVIADGSYNNEGLTPSNYSSFEKCALGWLEFQPLTEGVMELPDLTQSNVAYVLPTEKPNEFYFFENRQQQGNDEFLPGHGMLVWHVEYKEDLWQRNEVNNVELRQHVDIVEADNEKTEETRDGDVFPGTMNVTSFGFTTKPKLASWNKKRLAFDLEDISESEDGVISFNAVASNSAVGEMATEKDENAVYFDLMGRRVPNPGKGIYICNGKKVVFLNR